MACERVPGMQGVRGMCPRVAQARNGDLSEGVCCHVLHADRTSWRTELPELSPFTHETRRSPLTILSPVLAGFDRLYFMPPRGGRSKRGKTNVEEAFHMQRRRAAQAAVQASIPSADPPQRAPSACTFAPPRCAPRQSTPPQSAPPQFAPQQSTPLRPAPLQSVPPQSAPA